MTSAEAESSKAILLEAIGMLPPDLRPMLRADVQLDILAFAGDGWAVWLSVRTADRCGGIIDDGDRPVGSEGSLRDVSAEALARRLEGIIRRWLAKGTP